MATTTTFPMIAKTFFGFEDILAEELKTLNAKQIEKGPRMVSFYGDTGFMYKANLSLRTALKILKPIARKQRIYTEEQLYDFVQSVNWSKYFTIDQTFSVHATVTSKKFKHSKYVALKTKDAIVDQFRKKFGMRPDVDTQDPDLSISLHLSENFCSIALDSSGPSLHQRGYRDQTNIAPINEVLAAGIIGLSGWKGYTDFIDPMCGSGTLLIEAAMIAANIPANINRSYFAFEKWQDWDKELFEKIKNSLLSRVQSPRVKIQGFDKAPSAVNKAHDNVSNANLDDFIEVWEGNFFDSKKEIAPDKPLHLLFNPPYGERLKLDADKFYENVGDTLKGKYPGSEAWFITTDLNAFKKIGLRPSRKIKVFNGGLEARLFQFKMYAGSKKAKFNTK